MDRQGLDAARGEVLHLILHQRHEGRDHEGQAVLHQRGDLETDRFAASGRQHGEHILPCKGGIDYLLLHRTELFVSPELL